MKTIKIKYNKNITSIENKVSVIKYPAVIMLGK